MRVPRLETCGVLAAALAACVAVGAANGQSTIATFADPATGATTPLFAVAGSTLTGGWSGTGLTLMTPVLPAPDFPNAHFTMTPLTIGANGVTNGGTIQFTDAANNPIFAITFSAGQLNSPVDFGATEFMSAANVDFTGSIVAGMTLTDPHSFAFSFANQTQTAEGYTATASFTSSAVPEPAALALLATGALLAKRRRSA